MLSKRKVSQKVNWSFNVRIDTFSSRPGKLCARQPKCHHQPHIDGSHHHHHYSRWQQIDTDGGAAMDTNIECDIVEWMHHGRFIETRSLEESCCRENDNRHFVRMWAAALAYVIPHLCFEQQTTLISYFRSAMIGHCSWPRTLLREHTCLSSGYNNEYVNVGIYNWAVIET